LTRIGWGRKELPSVGWLRMAVCYRHEPGLVMHWPNTERLNSEPAKPGRWKSY